MRNSFKAGFDPNRGKLLRDSLWRLDQGSTTVISIGIVASLSTLFAGLGVALSLATGIVRAQLIADLAALSAADTYVGAIAGYPCEVAESIAIRNGASLTTCRIVGEVAQVSTTTSLGPFQVSRWAEAG